MKSKYLVGGALGAALALVTLVLVIILPASETTCGAGTPVVASVTSALTEPNCPATGLAAETGLQDGALRVLRCTVARFGTMDMRGVINDDAYPDHRAGRAVEFIVGADQAKGDSIVSFLQENAAAFRIDYVIWKQRSWTPGASAGIAWNPLEDRGDTARNHMDRVQVTIKAAASTSTVPVVSPSVSLAAMPGTVNEAGRLSGAGRRQYPLAAGAFTISDVFGARGGTHMGVDMAAPAGTPIYAASDGLVVASGPASGFGDWVVIDSLDESGKRYSTVYGHMYDNGIFVRTGDIVTMGQHIADVGSNGESSGAHLHFEVVPGGRLTGGHQVDPMPWLSGASLPTATVPNCENGFGTAGGNLASGKVPPELEVWYRRAGSLCPEISSSLLAAQGQAESGFRRGLTSPAGAQGLAQFLPSTAASLAPDGQPYVIDADGNGTASLWDDGDAIIGQGRYMCAIAQTVKGWMQEGKVSGDLTELTVAAYNAGEGAVLASGGMPNQVPGHFSETRPYVARILAAEASFRSMGSGGRFTPDAAAALGPQIVSAGHEWLGTRWVFGGGGTGGPTNGGFDEAGLAVAAVFTASGGTITLPSTAEQQWEIGTEVSLLKATAGDLVFGNFGPRGPATVGIYQGNGRMIYAEPNGTVAETPLLNGMKARRIGQ
ncbi:peptidoglycan DD-metalloendopeptidase family protein [Nocardia sp. NPDC051030]|uniref:peptidoglycan DD-metalloendopeptidase family protein n=1 Tax=Nocardia sp. NPDC051030 TaxID=3155162 RepID=UPI003438869B